jgi:ADP-dependent NAD(P)H-hydrate dehydratase / NAD(P)H-hydrate epimerase
MSRPILTAAGMRAAESAAIAAGTPAMELMERAGAAAAEAIWRFAGPLPTLVLCGPGNNGGDGYVIARLLAERGAKVRVAVLAEPGSPEARAARARWPGPVEALATAAPAPLLVDALFGTGLTRALLRPLSTRLAALARAARVRVAIDLPSGVTTDDGFILSPVPDFDLTITFATLKPSHLLQPAARHMGRLVVADIGIQAESRLRAVCRPKLEPPGPGDHKFNRGFVAVQAGEMPGASALTAAAAARSGAGYVRFLSDKYVAGLPHAIVQQSGIDIGEDERLDVMVAGPGFGRSEDARRRLRNLVASRIPLVLDADGLNLLEGAASLKNRVGDVILTPHGGEFGRLFGSIEPDKVFAVREAAALSGAVVVLKGADTVVAAPDGEAAIHCPPHWLATAGTGDVLAGVIAAIYSHGLDAFDAACAGVWLHSRAAELAGPGLIADDLLDHLPAALAECL